jgi:hypothetical protein
MAADVIVSRELESLQDELSAAQRERLAAPAAPPTTPPSSTEPAFANALKTARIRLPSRISLSVTCQNLRKRSRRNRIAISESSGLEMVVTP